MDASLYDLSDICCGRCRWRSEINNKTQDRRHVKWLSSAAAEDDDDAITSLNANNLIGTTAAAAAVVIIIILRRSVIFSLRPDPTIW